MSENRAALPAAPDVASAITGALRLLILAVVIGVSLSQIVLSVLIIPSLPPDTDAYWQAALRLREGEPLYVPADDVLARDVYRYAPWFAYAWVPLTHLPQNLVQTAWVVLMVVCTVAALIPMLMARTLTAVALAMLIGWLTLQTALFGNVQPLLIAGLVWTVDRRTGPVWIAVAASLKFVPILYVVVYLARRQWQRAFFSIGLTCLLVAPMLAFDLSGYTTTPGHTLSLYSVHPLIWAAVGLVALATSAVLSARQSRFSWLAASIAVLVAYPQAHLSYASHLLVGTRREPEAGPHARGAHG